MEICDYPTSKSALRSDIAGCSLANRYIAPCALNVNKCHIHIWADSETFN